MQKPNNAVASPSMCALLPSHVYGSNLTSLLLTKTYFPNPNNIEIVGIKDSLQSFSIFVTRS